MTYETLKIEKEGVIDWVTLNRPDALNSLNIGLVDDLLAYFGALYFDRAVRVVVLRGAGKAFCAGLDLKESGRRRNVEGGSTSGSAAGLDSQRRISEIVMRMRRCPQPIISLVHGPACGGGFALALAADVRIAGESARMNAAFIRIGLSACDVGVSYFLPRIVGASVAAELLLTGNFIDAARAERVGLVSRVVPDVDLEDAARALAQDMLRNSPLGLRLTKECLKLSLDAGSLEEVVAMEDRNQILAARGADFREGVMAFLEKRPARFRDA